MCFIQKNNNFKLNFHFEKFLIGIKFYTVYDLDYNIKL